MTLIYTRKEVKRKKKISKTSSSFQTRIVIYVIYSALSTGNISSTMAHLLSVISVLNYLSIESFV